jgi:hypothetical protein
MPVEPRYDDDFYAWTQHQAAVLRSMPVTDNRFDREHVAEEIEDLGKSARDAAQPDPPHHRAHPTCPPIAPIRSTKFCMRNGIPTRLENSHDP